MTRSDSSLRMLASDKEGMIRKVVCLLFFAFVVAFPVLAEDYLVQKGDTGTSIAQRKKLPAEVLQRANPDSRWDLLKVGDRLVVPERYTVKAGDTLYSLARLWGVDQAAVLALNNLTTQASLKTGQVLYIPPRTKAKVTAVSNPAQAGSAPFWPVERTPHPEGDKLKSVTFASTGEPFRSVNAGTVVYLGEFRGVGRVLLVQGVDQTVFAYGNFEKASVEFGQVVTRGQVLGTTSPRTSQKLSFFAFKQTDSLDVFTAKR